MIWANLRENEGHSENVIAQNISEKHVQQKNFAEKRKQQLH